MPLFSGQTCLSLCDVTSRHLLTVYNHGECIGESSPNGKFQVREVPMVVIYSGTINDHHFIGNYRFFLGNLSRPYGIPASKIPIWKGKHRETPVFEQMTFV